MTEQTSKHPVVIMVSPEEAEMASRVLARLSRPSLEDGRQNPQCDDLSTKAYDLGRIAKLIYSTRRDRSLIFSEDLFADPAWDMLIALYCAYEIGDKLTMSSVIYSAAIPYTTGIRWVNLLKKAELIVAGQHASDRRLVMLELTQKGLSRVEQCLRRSAKTASELLG